MQKLKIKCPNCGVEFEFEYNGTPIRECPVCGEVLVKNKNVTSDFVIIANTLTEYKGASSKVNIPDGVTRIGRNAFSHIDLDEVNFPNTLKVIDQGAFKYTKLSSIKLNDGLERIEKDAFLNSEIKELTLPISVVYCSPAAFGVEQLFKLTFEKTEWLNKECNYFFPKSKEYVINGEMFNSMDIFLIEFVKQEKCRLYSNNYDFDIFESTLIACDDVKSEIDRAKRKIRKDELTAKYR